MTEFRVSLKGFKRVGEGMEQVKVPMALTEEEIKAGVTAVALHFGMSITELVVKQVGESF